MDTELSAWQRQAMRAANKDRRAYAKAKRRANRERIKHGLCKCSDDERVYISAEESAADQAPAVRCSGCGREKLIVKILNLHKNAHLERAAQQDLMRGILR